MQEFRNFMDENMMTSLIIIILVIFIIGLIIFKVYQLINRRRYYKKITQLETKVNLTKNFPIQYRLNKINAMHKTEELEKKFSEWAKAYIYLSKDETSDIEASLNVVEEFLANNQFKKAKYLLDTVDGQVDSYYEQMEMLSNDLESVTETENRSRSEVTTLKEVFRNLRKLYLSNKNIMNYSEKAIFDLLEDIDFQFSEIENALSLSRHDEAKELIDQTELKLGKLKDVIDYLPNLIKTTFEILPNQLSALVIKQHNLLDLKFNLEHLKIDEKIVELKEEIETIEFKLLNLEIEGVESKLKECSSAIKEVMEQLQLEENALVELQTIMPDIFKRIDNIEQNSNLANQQMNELNELYQFSDQESQNLAVQTKIVQDLCLKKRNLEQEISENHQPFSQIATTIRSMKMTVESLEFVLDTFLERIEEMRSDERKAKAELQGMVFTLKETQMKLKNRRLPEISSIYDEVINEAKIAIELINQQLNARPIDTESLNLCLIDGKEIIYKLYENAKELIKTAQMAENAITFANKYRTSYLNVESELTKAEVFFNNGEYTKSLQSALEAIEIIHPGAQRELLEYKIRNNS